MAEPTTYELDDDFSATDKGTQLNVQLQKVQISTESLAGAIAGVRRSDGALQNEIVTRDSLAPGLENDIVDGAISLAAEQAGIATGAAAAALASESAAETAAGAAETAAGRVDLGALDEAVAATAGDAIQTGLDAAQAALDAAQTTADVSATTALTAQAEAARDAALAAALTLGAYVDTTLAAAIVTGLASVAEGETFYATGDDVDYIGLYKDVAGVAIEQPARVPKTSYIDNLPIPSYGVSITRDAGISLGEYYADYSALYAATITDISGAVINGGIGAWVDFYLLIDGVPVSGPHRAQTNAPVLVTGLSEAVAVGDAVTFSITSASTDVLVTEAQITANGVLA